VPLSEKGLEPSRPIDRCWSWIRKWLPAHWLQAGPQRNRG